MPDSIRDTIRTQTADSQVPTCVLCSWWSIPEIQLTADADGCCIPENLPLKSDSEL